MRPNVTPSPRRVDGVRGPVIGRRGTSLRPKRIKTRTRTRITKAKARAKGLTVTLSLSLRLISRPKPSLRRLV